MQTVNVIGGGLAGCEAAHRLAGEGFKVKLWEMRPAKNTPVHITGQLAELVCSNSLKSERGDTAQGLLKCEMRTLSSLLLSCAYETRVPAGAALAVDRHRFPEKVTRVITSNPHIELVRQELTGLPPGEISVVATGPLTSDAFSQYLLQLTGEDNLYFYDAIAPSITAESIDMNRVYRATRYGKGSDDYLNCPMNEAEYDLFYNSLIAADIKTGHEIDNRHLFNACMPVEIIADKGRDTLRFGPMRPVGLKNPESNERPHAVVQLRQEDQEGHIYGLVGFQTRLRWKEQDRVFRLIPGLEKAEFVRYGSMHRNTYINSPKMLENSLQYKANKNIFFAGQITGVEGYMESAATGIVAGINAARWLRGQDAAVFPPSSIIGALVNFVTTATIENFQPINANFGLLPPLDGTIKDKQKRNAALVNRALNELGKYSELFI